MNLQPSLATIIPALSLLHCTSHSKENKQETNIEECINVIDTKPCISITKKKIEKSKLSQILKTITPSAQNGLLPLVPRIRS
jgi:hypothetical protein